MYQQPAHTELFFCQHYLLQLASLILCIYPQVFTGKSYSWSQALTGQAEQAAFFWFSFARWTFRPPNHLGICLSLCSSFVDLRNQKSVYFSRVLRPSSYLVRMSPLWLWLLTAPVHAGSSHASRDLRADLCHPLLTSSWMMFLYYLYELTIHREFHPGLLLLLLRSLRFFGWYLCCSADSTFQLHVLSRFSESPPMFCAKALNENSRLN